MKILAIRGKNLASLAGEFALDFSRPPLSETGLFVISGPTGAGKSTLLDALCLALYNNTSRLEQAKAGVELRDVGKETLAQHHTATLLRRRCTEAWAEVDFVAKDQHTYRARWSVARARGRAEGRIQAVNMRFARLSDTLDPETGKAAEEQVISTQLNQTKACIEEKIGLNFAQFTRSVLLAQNEFGLFLKANDDERAQLLEALTGTDIYARISKKAFERAKAEQEALAALETQLTQGAPLPEDERTALQSKHDAAKAKRAACAATHAEAQGLVRWFDTQAHWDEQVRKAREGLENAQHAWAKAEDTRRQVTQWEKAQQAQPLVTEKTVHLQLLEHNAQAQAQASVQAENARKALAHAQAELTHAYEAHQAALAAQRQAEPALAQAREWDIRLSHAAEALRHTATVLADAQEKEAQTRQTCAQYQKERAQQQKEQARLSLWLQEHEHLALLAKDWTHWQHILMEAARAFRAQRASEKQCVALEKQEAEQRIQHAAATQALEKATQALAQEEAALSALGQEDDTHALDQALAAQKKAEEAYENTAAALTLWTHWVDAQQNTLDSDTQCAESHRLLAESERTLETLKARLAKEEAALATERDAVEQARLAHSANVKALRAALEEGMPCPVCGSQTHPYWDDDAAMARVLSLAEKTLHTQATQVKTTQEAVLKAEKTHALQQAEWRQWEKTKHAHEQTRAALTQRWHKEAVAWHALPETERTATLTAAIAQRQADKAQAACALEQALAAQKARQKAQKTVDAARASREQALKAHAPLAFALEHTAQAHRDEKTALATLNEQYRLLHARLCEAFCAPEYASWEKAWQADSEGFVAQMKARVAAFLTHKTALEALVDAQQAREPVWQGLNAQWAAENAQLSTAKAAHEAALKAQASAQQARQQCCQGRAVADVETALRTAIATAEHAKETAQTAYQTQLNRLEHYEHERALLQAQAIEHQQRHDAAAQRLSTWLATQGALAGVHDDSQLSAVLACAEAEMEAQRNAILALKKACDQAMVALAEQEKGAQAHRAHAPKEGDRAFWAQQAAQAQMEEEEAMADVQSTRLQLEHDTQRRTAALALQDQLQKQADETRRWSQLNALIGSADGRKFRHHAQQLTMDILLIHANEHMQGLNRRYRLERIPDKLALQVIDQDMGEEVRSVYSLSGGESFLVSLALALGLASLSAERTRIESLFIDEGFGSLDSDTLQVAMGALDALQAQGRKVGVITHVQEMTERIEVKIALTRGKNGRSELHLHAQA